MHYDLGASLYVVCHLKFVELHKVQYFQFVFLVKNDFLIPFHLIDRHLSGLEKLVVAIGTVVP